FGVVGGTPGAGDQPVAWAAHIAGFIFGLVAIRFFVPAPPSLPPEPPRNPD
ncbi:MAG: rhomboid family intramembrane serine protease, partial [Proteobacteria bacterium]|nr:rhomboid family intramembrane serine protease [Pseudomonadota bacterium]